MCKKKKNLKNGFLLIHHFLQPHTTPWWSCWKITVAAQMHKKIISTFILLFVIVFKLLIRLYICILLDFMHITLHVLGSHKKIVK